jgi:hypothetical protein
VNEISKIRPESELRRVPLAAISIDPSVQQRAAGKSQEVVEDYAPGMRDGDEFPPPTVFSNDGVTYYLADGFHRVDAYRLAHPDAQEIVCELRCGDREDVMIWACGANTRHGLRLSRLDKLKAVTTLLNIQKCSSWSDRQIARQVGVSHPLVAQVRRKHLEKLPDACPHRPDDGQRERGHAASALPVPEKPDDVPVAAKDRRRTVIRRGKSYTMRTAGIGVSRTTPRQPQDSKAKPPLTSLAWSMANKQDRIKFISAVGGHEILDALKAVAPGFDLLDWAWKAAGPAERQSFAKQYYDEITALAAAAPEQSTNAVLAVTKQDGGDPLAIPTFLQRDIPKPP